MSLFKTMKESTLRESTNAHCGKDFTWVNRGILSLAGKSAAFDRVAGRGVVNDIPNLAGIGFSAADLIHIASKKAVTAP